MLPQLQGGAGQACTVRLRIRQQVRRRTNRWKIRRLFLLRGMRRHQLQQLQSLMGGRIRIGTRGSRLALWQANWVKTALEKIVPDRTVHLEIIKTRGDKITDVPLAQIGGNALFVKELELALEDGRIDIAVHSMKDMPSSIPEGLCIGAVPQREAPWDVLIAKEGASFDALPPNARIGTSSLRRQAQLLHHRPDLTMVPLRGNLDTRIGKLATEQLDAIVVAAAGVNRLGFDNRVTQTLPADILLPAVAQGALGIEIRKNDTAAARWTAPLNHPSTSQAVTAERAFLRRLGGSCQVPMAAYGAIEDGILTLRGLVAALDGRAMVAHTVSGPVGQAEQLGDALGMDLLSKGADIILDDILSEIPCNDKR